MIKNELTIIAAASTNNIIGLNNKLIWDIPRDLNRFKDLTQGHSVIMGRKTFESLPNPLPNRTNIVVTRNTDYHYNGVIVCKSIEEALNHCKSDSQPFVIGGGEIYSAFLPKCKEIYLTKVQQTIQGGDVFFPSYQNDFYCAETLEKNEDFTIEKWRRNQ